MIPAAAFQYKELLFSGHFLLSRVTKKEYHNFRKNIWLVERFAVFVWIQYQTHTSKSALLRLRRLLIQIQLVCLEMIHERDGSDGCHSDCDHGFKYLARPTLF